ncbi:hypothetical protein [Gimesia fumaroli]|uniref:Uncharacterized protein n=1 Tax=Gimesia fumaroli TaxID=2527976 RepID=A0A518I8R0_9PLAN|nr:hypothetical protein [Gimesia fumaroli]QDV49480.1 hypothetical protein Enr17x_14980 [Gimesia fumaroli]
MQFQHSGMALLLALVCVSSSCQQSEHENLVGRWQSTGGPNMIFREDGTVYSINRGPRRKGRYYLNTETEPATIIMDMRKSDINAVLYFDYAAFSDRHIELTPTFVQRTGEKKKESEIKRKMLFRKIDPNDPLMGEKRFAAKTTPGTPTP